MADPARSPLRPVLVELGWNTGWTVNLPDLRAAFGPQIRLSKRIDRLTGLTLFIATLSRPPDAREYALLEQLAQRCQERLRAAEEARLAAEREQALERQRERVAAAVTARPKGASV